MGKKRKLDEFGHDFSVMLFIDVWNHLSTLVNEKQEFALCWLLKHDDVLKVFGTTVLKIECQRFCKSLLYNGYNNCKNSQVPIFSPDVWEKIDSVFGSGLCMAKAPGSLTALIGQFSKFGPKKLQTLLKKQIAVFEYSTHITKREQTVHRVSTTVLQKCTGCVLGDWMHFTFKAKEQNQKFTLVSTPTDFVVMETSHNCNFFYDRSGKTPFLIAVVICQHVLTPPFMANIRHLLEMLFNAHEPITRGHEKASYESYMKGFGPHRERFAHDTVSFYTHDEKIGNGFSDCRGESQSTVNNASKFEALIDQYSHTELVDIIIGLYLQWCPQLLQSFFDFCCPYLSSKEYTRSDFEIACKKMGPPAYQLYISRDYCVTTHADNDVTDLTLCYVSHPDSHISPIDFVIPEYGIRLPIRDGNLFAFQSSVVHGTAFRVPTAMAAYVGAITINRLLSRLLRKLQLL